MLSKFCLLFDFLETPVFFSFHDTIRTSYYTIQYTNMPKHLIRLDISSDALQYIQLLARKKADRRGTQATTIINLPRRGRIDIDNLSTMNSGYLFDR
ncbi:hypothetical protein L1887_11649 [Cichorium endivia]|nr:hypothetical protein L1887_11649 [Cichorium endivia]